MSIPTYDKFIEPMLRYLAQHTEGAPASVVYEAVGNALNITDNDKLTLLPSRTQPVYKNRAGWAHDRLKRAGLSSSPRRGYWKLTGNGLAFAQTHQSPLSDQQIKELAVVDPAVRLRPLREFDENNDVSNFEQSAKGSVATPDDLLEGALSELEEATASDLLETIGRGSPKFFETLVLDLLHAMGYGASRDDLQHVGRSHDEGIDGIISLDRLGLERFSFKRNAGRALLGVRLSRPFMGHSRASAQIKGFSSLHPALRPMLLSSLVRLNELS
jgi:restriction system protein